MNYKEFIENEFKIVPKEGGAPVPFKFNVVQDKYYQQLKKDYPDMQGVRENILKARQEGFSSLIDAIFAVDFITQENITGQIISHKKKETEALIQRVNSFIDSFLENNGITRKDLLKTDSKEFLENNVKGSELFIGTAGAKTLGRGDTLQNLHWSEVGFYPNTEILSAEKLVGGAEQQVATGVGKIFRESTGNVQEDYWYREVKRSENGESNFNFRFFAWFEHPEYAEPTESFDPTPEERDKMNQYGISEAQMNWYRKKMSDFETKALGLREYPTIPEEAFLAAGEAFFDPDSLKYLYDRAREPIEVGGLAMDGQWASGEGPFKLFREPQAEEDTVIGADPADGGSDYCAAVVKSKKHGDSFMNFSARMESSQFGYELNKMGKFIKKKTGKYPIIAVERNTGAATVYVLQQLNYPHLFRMRSFDTMENKESDRIGWVTNTQTRPKMLDDLSLSLKQRVNTIHDIEEIKQLMGFIRHPRTGKPQAVSGNYDDFVIAEAIAWQLYQIAQVVTPEALQEKAQQFKPLDLPTFVKK